MDDQSDPFDELLDRVYSAAVALVGLGTIPERLHNAVREGNGFVGVGSAGVRRPELVARFDQLRAALGIKHHVGVEGLEVMSEKAAEIAAIEILMLTLDRPDQVRDAPLVGFYGPAAGDDVSGYVG